AISTQFNELTTRAMRMKRVLSIGLTMGFLAVTLGIAVTRPAQAAWVNGAGTQFQVGGAYQFTIGGQPTTTIVPTAVGTSFIDPTGGSQGGTSLVLVPGFKAGLDPVKFPLVLVVSCLDNGGSTTVPGPLNFVNPAHAKAVKH